MPVDLVQFVRRSLTCMILSVKILSQRRNGCRFSLHVGFPFTDVKYIGPPSNSLRRPVRSARISAKAHISEPQIRLTSDFYTLEFILLSDTLGVSSLVDSLNHAKPPGATEATVLGPFFTTDALDCQY